MDIDTSLPTMITVVDVQFKSGGKCYSFDPGELELDAGQEIIIDTQRGLEFGICQRGNHNVLSDQVVQPLRPVVRLADDADRQRLKENADRETQAFDICNQLVERLALDMKLVRVECAFDGSKLLFFFTSDGRVDFRELVKELAAVFRTRIEMRQIGVRDEAKLLGGIGICGRPFCCAQFLDDFQPVSIKMAKTQNLSLNPTKISGTCGRLMCCLKYEQDTYEDLIASSPRQGSLVDTVDGRGTVTEASLLRQQVKVSLEDSPDTIKYYRNEDIAVLRNGRGKKTDPPIPSDIAPISGNPERRAQILRETQPVVPPVPDIFFPSDAADPVSGNDRPARYDAPRESGSAESGRNRNHRRRSKNDGSGSAPSPRPQAQRLQEQRSQEQHPQEQRSQEQRPQEQRPQEQRQSEPRPQGQRRSESARRNRHSSPKPTLSERRDPDNAPSNSVVASEGNNRRRRSHHNARRNKPRPNNNRNPEE